MIFIFYFDEKRFYFRGRIGYAPAEPITMRVCQLCAMVNLVDGLHLPQHCQLLRSLINHSEDVKKNDTRGNGDSKKQT